MSSRILTTDFSGLDDFIQDHAAVLAKSASGAVAVFANNAPAFYALTPERLAQLLELEAKLARPGSDVALDTQFFDEPGAAPTAIPVGKFAMYADWQPDADFQRMAALWGIALSQPVTAGRAGGVCRLLAGGRQSLSSCAMAAKAGAQRTDRPGQQRRPAAARCEYGQRTR